MNIMNSVEGEESDIAHLQIWKSLTTEGVCLVQVTLGMRMNTYILPVEKSRQGNGRENWKDSIVKKTYIMEMELFPVVLCYIGWYHFCYAWQVFLGLKTAFTRIWLWLQSAYFWSSYDVWMDLMVYVCLQIWCGFWLRSGCFLVVFFFLSFWHIIRKKEKARKKAKEWLYTKIMTRNTNGNIFPA